MKKLQMTNLHYALFVIIFNFGDVGERNVDTILGQMAAQSYSYLRKRFFLPQDRMGSELDCWLHSMAATSPRVNHKT